MRFLRGLLLAALFAWALWPELPRYRGEHLLRGTTDMFRRLVSKPGEFENPRGALLGIEQVAFIAAAGLPGDSRSWILAGSTRLVAEEPARALELYREALARGERAEIDINMGRAYEANGEPEKARAAFLRVVWISPALFPALLPDIQASLLAECNRLEEDLRAGRLKAPPPLP